jgi:predicted signal transduction protein with EAL and GGDEF domain
VLLTETSSEGQVNDFSDTLLAILSSPIPLDGLEINATASAGIVIDEAGRSHGEHILRDAGLAMFQAKELGRNRSQLFVPGMRERAETRMDLLRDLHHVIENNQLEAFYQPKVNLQALKIVGFEALLRWRHPVRGLINPYQFVPLAEESGLILPVGDWILSEATRQLVAWQRTYPLAAALSMNVNLSVKQLVDPGLLVREEYSFGTSRTWDWPETRRLWKWLFIVELSARATFRFAEN